MNATPDMLVQIIGKQQVMIEMLNAKVKELENGRNRTISPDGPPAWTQAAAQKDRAP